MRDRVLLMTTTDGPLELGVDGAGRWVAPTGGGARVDLRDLVTHGGLVDAHAHLAASSIDEMRNPVGDPAVAVATHAAAQLAGGVTLVADKGTYAWETVDMVLDLPEEDRPAAQLAGRLLASPGGYYPGVAEEVEGPELARTAASYPPERASWVKVIGDWPRRGLGAVANFDEDELAAAVATAHRQGRRLAVHTAAPGAASLAVRAGVDSVEHGLFLTEDDVAMLAERGGAWVPTIRAMETLAGWLGEESSGGALINEGLTNVRRLLADADEAGVSVQCGTDLVLDHGTVVAEAAALVEYGLDEPAAIRALTSGPRRYLGEPPFTLGAPADLVAVDPPSGLAELGMPRMVMRCGRLVLDRR